MITAPPVFPAYSLAQQAEQKIIRRLLKQRFFEDDETRRLLANYHRAEFSRKEDLILALTKRLWEKNSLSDISYVLRDFDSILGALEKKGHFIHQFEVFLLGWHFISILLESNKMPSLGNKRYKPDEYFVAWLLVSTTHDLGYPFELGNRIAEKFSSMYKDLGLDELSKRYLGLYKDYTLLDERNLMMVKTRGRSGGSGVSTDLQQIIRNSIERTLKIGTKDSDSLMRWLAKKKNHGLISAFILCHAFIKSLFRVRQSISPGRRKTLMKIMETAVPAVALHALPVSIRARHIKRIKFETHPVAYILLLIDELQEWSRSLRASEIWPYYTLFDFSSDKDSLMLNYQIRHKSWSAATETAFRKALCEKRRRLRSLSRPKPPINFELTANFSSDHGLNFKPISLKL